jgi:hypothetical protein
MASYNTTKPSSNSDPSTLEGWSPFLVAAHASMSVRECTEAASNAGSRTLRLSDLERFAGSLKSMPAEPERGAGFAQGFEDSVIRRYLERRERRRCANERIAWTRASVRRASLRPQRAARTRRPAGVHVQRSRRTTRRARAAPSSEPDSSSPDPPLVAPSLRRSAPFRATAAELRRAVAWLSSPAVRTPRTKCERAPWAPSPRYTLKFSLADFVPVTSQHCRNRMNHMPHRKFT